MKAPFPLRLAAFALLILHPSSSLHAQGPLTPPGAPAPVMKTLQQVEPRIDLQNAPASAVTTTNAAYHYIITQPGSYYLSANLDVTKTNGIQINAAGVTLDLNGFEISRATGTGGNGIEIRATAHRAGVRNGSLKGFAFGIWCIPFANFARGCGFRDIRVSGCTSYGIYAGTDAVLESCRAHENSGSAAIIALRGSSLTHCTASGNTSNYGILAGDGSSLAYCTASGNTSNYGIFAGNGSSLAYCTAEGNTGSFGIFADNGSSLAHCTASGNLSSAATSAGIGTASGVTITDCAAYLTGSTAATLTPTTGMGFKLGTGSTIQNCTAYSNRGDGINVPSDCVVRANVCYLTGSGSGDGAGIHATGNDNRIEANNVSNNDRGIDADSGGNVILKNTASGNTTNYVLAANNVFGAIVDRTASASAAVSGNSAASSAGTTDPWANFAY